MTEVQALRNVRLYMLFMWFREPLFIGAILIHYCQHAANTSLSQMYLIEACSTVFIMLLEIPTGVVADLIGRKKTIFIGMIFRTADLVFLALATSPWMVWVGDFLWVIAVVLCSGADEAFLRDSLASCGKEDRFAHIYGRAQSMHFALAAMGSIATGFLADIHLRLPIALSGAFILIALVAVARFYEPPRGKPISRDAGLGIMRSSLSLVTRHHTLLWLICFEASIVAISQVWFFTYNPYFEYVGIDVKWYGLIFFTINIVAMVSSHYADWTLRRCGEYGSVALISLLISVPIILMALAPIPLMASLIMLQNLVRGYYRPFIGKLYHERINSDERATSISVKSACVSCITSISNLAYGVVSGFFPLITCLYGLGIGSLAIGIGLNVWFIRHWQKK